MAYTVVTTDKSVLTWDNPHGGVSTATVVDGAITEIVVPAAGGGNIIYSVDQTDLSHLNTVITELLAFINPM